MRQPQELQKGQIAPQARGIEAFLSPKDRQLATPNQPSQMPAPSQFTTVSTAPVQGFRTKNSFARLAEDLADFSPTLMKTAQSMGLAYADSEMRKGEEAAREAAARALALNDAQMERAELVAAAETRRVARKDPQAGQFMASLNPYFSMGYQRGMVKKAGLEASAGLPAFFQRKSAENPIDYTAPDMGIGQLVKWQAEYTNQLAGQYGIDASTPGFQKYFLNNLEKAREDFNQTFLDDRKNFFDKAAVSSTTGQVSELYRSSETNGYVEYNGQKIYQSQNPEAFQLVRTAQANQLINAGVLSASLPGEAAERSEKIYKGLVQEAYFNNDESMLEFANNIQGNQRVIGPDGKAVMGPDGKPLTLSWGSQFGGSNIDQQIKYEEKGFQIRQQQNLERATGFDDQLLDVASQYPPGPEQRMAVDAFITDYYNTVGREAGIPRSELLKRARGLLKEDDSIYYEQGNARPADEFAERVSSSVGDDFDPVALRREMYQVAGTLPPSERSTFISQQSARIRQKENDQRSMSGYKGTRDAVIRQAVKARREQYYDFGKDIFGNPRTNRENISESDRLQTDSYTARANALILKREGELGRPLTDAEARQMTNAAIYGDRDLGIAPYGEGVATGPGSLADLFPGSNKTTTPGVDGNTGNSDSGTGITGLSDVDKSVLLNYRSQPVLNQQGALDAYDLIDSKDPLPPGLDKAWREAGAKSAADFVLNQMDVWRVKLSAAGASQEEIGKYKISGSERSKLLKRWKEASAAGQTPVSYAATQQRTPALAVAGNWALNALTGSTAAAAGELPPELRGGSNRRPSAVAVRPSQPAVASASGGRRPTPIPVERFESAPPAPELPPAPAAASRQESRTEESGAPAAREGGRWVGTASSPVGELKQSRIRGFYTDEQGNLFQWQDPRSRIGRRPTRQAPRVATGGLPRRRRLLGAATRGSTVGGVDSTPFQSILGVIRSGEGSWDSANRSKAGDTPGGIPGLSRKTLGEWKRLQNQDGYFALGAYQFIPATLRLAAREAGIPDNTVMSPEIQDRLAIQLMIGSKRPALTRYLTGRSNNLNAAQTDLSLEWAAAQGPSGAGQYDGDAAGNNASISSARIKRALIELRRLLLSQPSNNSARG